MVKKLFLVLLLFIFACSYDDEEGGLKRKGIRLGNFIYYVEEYKCDEEKIPEGYSIVLLRNLYSKASLEITFDGPEYFRIVLNPKQDKELKIKAGSYNVVFFSSAKYSRFTGETGHEIFSEKQCKIFSVDVVKAPVDYDRSQSDQPEKEWPKN